MSLYVKQLAHLAPTGFGVGAVGVVGVRLCGGLLPRLRRSVAPLARRAWQPLPVPQSRGLSSLAPTKLLPPRARATVCAPLGAHLNQTWTQRQTFLALMRREIASKAQPTVVREVKDLEGGIRPAQQQWVCNLDGVLSSSEAAELNAELVDIQKATGVPIAVYLIQNFRNLDQDPTFRGRELEAFVESLHANGAAFDTPARGVVVAYFGQQRALHIFAGSQVDSVLTVRQALEIQRVYMVPAFKNNRVLDGMVAGVRQIRKLVATLNFQPAPTSNPTPAATATATTADAKPNQQNGEQQGGQTKAEEPSGGKGGRKRGWWSDFKEWNRSVWRFERPAAVTGLYVAGASAGAYFLWQGAKWLFWASVTAVALYVGWRAFKWLVKTFFPDAAERMGIAADGITSDRKAAHALESRLSGLESASRQHDETLRQHTNTLTQHTTDLASINELKAAVEALKASLKSGKTEKKAPTKPKKQASPPKAEASGPAKSSSSQVPDSGYYRGSSKSGASTTSATSSPTSTRGYDEMPESGYYRGYGDSGRSETVVIRPAPIRVHRSPISFDFEMPDTGFYRSSGSGTSSSFSDRSTASASSINNAKPEKSHAAGVAKAVGVGAGATVLRHDFHEFRKERDRQDAEEAARAARSRELWDSMSDSNSRSNRTSSGRSSNGSSSGSYWGSSSSSNKSSSGSSWGDSSPSWGSSSGSSWGGSGSGSSWGGSGSGSSWGSSGSSWGGSGSSWGSSGSSSSSSWGSSSSSSSSRGSGSSSSW